MGTQQGGDTPLQGWGPGTSPQLSYQGYPNLLPLETPLEEPFPGTPQGSGLIEHPNTSLQGWGGMQAARWVLWGGGLKTLAAPWHGGAGGDAGARRLQKLPGHVRGGRDEATTEAGVHETVYWRRTEALAIHDTPLSPPPFSFPHPVPSPPPAASGDRQGGSSTPTLGWWVWSCHKPGCPPPFHLKC